MDIINLLDKNFLREKGLIKIEIAEQLYSKKNRLFKIKCLFEKHKYNPLNDSLFVFKQYHGVESAERKNRETFMLNSLNGLLQNNKKSNGLLVPELFCEGKDYIITYFVSGETLLDYVIKNENEERNLAKGDIICFSVFKSCIDWIVSFHNESKKLVGRSCILSDINLRNFIVCTTGENTGKIYRVDFEDWNEGYIERDLGKLIAFILTYDPMLTEWKIKLSQYIKSYIVEKLRINKSNLEKEIKAELKEMISRRSLDAIISRKLLELDI